MVPDGRRRARDREPALRAISRKALARKTGPAACARSSSTRCWTVMYDLPSLGNLTRVIVDERPSRTTATRCS